MGRNLRGQCGNGAAAYSKVHGRRVGVWCSRALDSALTFNLWILFEPFAAAWRGSRQRRGREAARRGSGAAGEAEPVVYVMMIMLFIVLFEKQTSYTFGEGTYSKARDVTKFQGCTHLAVCV